MYALNNKVLASESSTGYFLRILTMTTDWISHITRSSTNDSFNVLLPVSYHVNAKPWISLDNVKMELSLEQYIKNDPFPLPETSDREGYSDERHYDYWLSGLKDYLLIKQVLARHSMYLNQSVAILDLGCASGRVLRHFLCQEPNIEVWGADINWRHIDWILRFLGTSAKVFQNTVLPHLPLPDNFMPLVYAFSVFTHIDEFELAWISEIHRILKPGGIAYITIHSNHTWGILNPTNPLYYTLLQMKDFIQEYDVSPELFTKPMPCERMVFKWPTVAPVYNCNVFHSIDYIHKVWGRFLNVIEVIEEGAEYQAVVVLKKK